MVRGEQPWTLDHGVAGHGKEGADQGGDNIRGFVGVSDSPASVKCVIPGGVYSGTAAGFIKGQQTGRRARRRIWRGRDDRRSGNWTIIKKCFVCRPNLKYNLVS